MTYQIRELTVEVTEPWDRFVETSPKATFFHRSSWRNVIQDTFGHKPYYHYVERDGRICGVLPLFHVNSRLFGNRLTSIPFCVAGSSVSETAEIDSMLDRRAIDLLDEVGADYIEYRDSDRHRSGWAQQADVYAAFLGELNVDADCGLRQIPRKQRAVLRKAMQSQALSFTIDDDTDDLYALYALSVRNLGTPVFPRSYFRNLKKEFSEACEVLTVRVQGKPISSVLSFYFRDRVMPYYTGCQPEARALGANDLMYWHVMRRAVERGYRHFDFGRSKIGTGPYNFKKNWGFEARPVIHQYYLHSGRKLPRVNPTNPKYRALIAMWRLLPLPLANVLGPLIVRGTG